MPVSKVECELYVRLEEIRFQPPLYHVACHVHRVCPTLSKASIETVFTGKGARKRAAEAAKKLREELKTTSAID
jgi:hypothetical protein